jgi:ketosteroid isomerase-like protein
MPWFPDFLSAVELVSRQTRSVGLADPVQQYFNALETGRTHELEDIWPGQVVIYDPREGEVRGHRHLRRFVHNNQLLWAERHARIETVASTSIDGRAVVELLAHLDDFDGQPVDWPIAVVAEFPDELSVVFRTYCSQWPVDGQHHIRKPVLEPAQTEPSDVVGRYLAALSAGDLGSTVSAFAPDGYFRESIGPHYLHQGTSELRSYFAGCFKAGGGLKLEHCTVTDDGVRCVLEFNCVRWGSHDLTPQAGIGVYERGSDGLLAAARIYDDIEAPV